MYIYASVIVTMFGQMKYTYLDFSLVLVWLLCIYKLSVYLKIIYLAEILLMEYFYL